MMTFTVIYLVCGMAVGVVVGYDAGQRGNDLDVSIGLGVLFGLVWPATAVIWFTEKLDRDRR